MTSRRAGAAPSASAAASGTTPHPTVAAPAAAPAAVAAPRRRPRPQPAAERPRCYWIGVVSRDHVARAVAGGFAEVSHGKAGPLERMRSGDGLLYYSPREQEGTGPPLMAFTALARIGHDAIEATEVQGQRFFRRPAHFLPTGEAPVKPLIEHLTFIRSKAHWGAAFRFGFLRIPEVDFARIAAALGRDFASDFPPIPGPPAGST